MSAKALSCSQGKVRGTTCKALADEREGVTSQKPATGGEGESRHRGERKLRFSFVPEDWREKNKKEHDEMARKGKRKLRRGGLEAVGLDSALRRENHGKEHGGGANRRGRSRDLAAEGSWGDENVEHFHASNITQRLHEAKKPRQWPSKSKKKNRDRKGAGSPRRPDGGRRVHTSWKSNKRNFPE